MAITDQLTALRTRPTWGAALSIAYGVAGYLAFVVASLYGVAFLADAWVPRTVDHGGPDTGPAVAVIVDALLLSVFALTHSVMARPAFKRQWTRLVPAHLERSTYVLVASASLGLAFWQWRPVPHVVWDVAQPGARVLVWTLYGLGWLWVLAMTFAIDHLDLVGLRQVGRHLRGLSERPAAFAVPWPHRLVRHPMMLGFFVAFLATPTMSVGHLLFAALGCGYILVGVRLEERNLVQALPEYAAYAAATPRFVPSRRPYSESGGGSA
jgi:protein-S-isoprenylcysteine O-methyltransferase Ste14